jgi:hypothetical protein
MTLAGLHIPPQLVTLGPMYGDRLVIPRKSEVTQQATLSEVCQPVAGMVSYGFQIETAICCCGLSAVAQ